MASRLRYKFPPVVFLAVLISLLFLHACSSPKPAGPYYRVAEKKYLSLQDAVFSMSTSALPRVFTWVIPLMGGDMAVRQWHHISMWFFIVFTLIHVYLVFYHDYVEGRGTTSSMVGGWKFQRSDRIDDARKDGKVC